MKTPTPSRRLRRRSRRPRRSRVLQWGTGDARSFLVPAWEIPDFEFLLNRFDHYASMTRGLSLAARTILQRICTAAWVVDNDKFSTNQFLHPYQGSIYQGFARSAGLDFWQASAYTFAAACYGRSGENTAPSINDQVATGIGGNFLGEPLFRMASLLLERRLGGHPGFWRELGAAAISPATGFNRLVYGKRFAPVFRSYDPAVFTRVDLGGNLSTRYNSNINVNADPSAPPAAQTLQRGDGSRDSSRSAYGLPGKPDYSYDRPFDYFNFELAADTANGGRIGVQPRPAVRHGLRGRATTTVASGDSTEFTTTAPQYLPGLQHRGALSARPRNGGCRAASRCRGRRCSGVGYAAGGVIRGAGVTAPSPTGEGQRNYHYGVAPESVDRLAADHSAIAPALDATARGYYISRLGATESTGSETIDRVDVALTVRVFSLHGITIRYSESPRRPLCASARLTSGRTSIAYTLLGDERLGAVDWRNGS